MNSWLKTFAVLLVTPWLAGGCESAYYSVQQQFGRMKPDILVDRVEDAMDAQEEAKVEFESALEQFEAVVGLKQTDLKATYNRLNDAFEDAESQAREVSSRIDSVEDVAEDLFEEWEQELDEISNAKLRRQSAQQLKVSQRKASALIGAMRKAESRMGPVLTSFKDHVLFLKHNLNAQAVASLKGELVGIESDVGRLVREMEASIREAQAFIEDMSSS